MVSAQLNKPRPVFSPVQSSVQSSPVHMLLLLATKCWRERLLISALLTMTSTLFSSSPYRVSVGVQKINPEPVALPVAEEVVVGATADTTMDTADGTTIGGEVIPGHAPISASAPVCM